MSRIDICQGIDCVFVKDGHYYYIQCNGEIELACSLIGIAIDPRLNLNMEDARLLMQNAVLVKEV